jgi:tetratricopeptide (TPR) repeat protein
VSRLTDDEPDTVESGSSPAIPRMRRATMDNGEIGAARKSKSPMHSHSNSTSPPPPPGGLRGALLRRFSGDGPIKRRGSHDSSDFEFAEETTMQKDEYVSIQSRLQRRADDLHKSGQIEEAISQWVECLALAEENGDTLSSKTEILCILVDLHLQASFPNHHEDGDGTTAPPEHTIKRHRLSAERYLHRIKPALVKPMWWSNTKQLLDFLVETEAWELALIVAVRLADEGQGPTPEQFATIHFQIASQKLDSNRQGEALQHLQATVKYLQLVSFEKRDMTMYLQVLELLASEYNSQGQNALALEAYQEILKCSPIEKHASLFCRMAHIHLVSQQLDLALEQLEAAASSLDSAEPSIRLELLQTKGDVYCRLGRMEESLEVYQNALEEAKNPAEKAKLLYTLGRLCVRLKHVRLAISYFTREMEITEQELGQQHLSVSRVLHELAKLYDEGLGEHKIALMKLHKALQIELAVLQECYQAIHSCPRCNQVTHRMCPKHANLQKDISNQIRETKKAQGRIHFKLGDFDKALKTSFDEVHSHRSKAAAN